ncbi:GntR family transcriptional regulator [Reyranella sp.]|uniref:GntR family transcriptional regulator n=1 Tax=Reyranella sp. TaxID=1929291 RepID=UPI0025CD29DB|nr:GntR family transcriptional regulator [Reyranella sp.]
MPLQTQIARWLEHLIVSGSLRAGDRLPAEVTLVERLGVSRVTVRLAMDELVSRGLVSRAHGKGSFVSPAVVRHDILSEQGFFDILLTKAPRPEVRLIAFESAVPPPKVANLFRLAPGTHAVKLDRLYLSAGRPIVLAANWLTPDAASLVPADIESMSTAAVHSVLLRHPIASSTSAIGAELAGATVARCLGVGARSAVLVLTRTRFDAQGQAREHNRFTVDPSSYEFTFTTKGDVSLAAELRAVAA